MTGRQPLQYLIDADQDPLRCIATQFHLLDAVAEGRRPALLYVYSLSRDVAALGRFHIAPERRHPALHRRIAGGRIWPMGAGFAGAALLLPRRDHLTAGGPIAPGRPGQPGSTGHPGKAGGLSPAQVMNRHVRGFLHGLRAVGLDPTYPGRDIVTVGKRIVAALSLETDARGAAVFDMVVAVSRSFAELPGILDRADPEGAALTRVSTADEATHLAAELGRRFEFEEFAALARRGFCDHLGADLAPAKLEAADDREIDRRVVDLGRSDGWVHGRCRTADLAWRGTAWGQIGAVEAYFAENRGSLGRVIVSGDFIANSPALAALEGNLRGCPRNPTEIDRVVAETFGGGGGVDYLLGLGDGAAIRDAISMGARW